MNTLSAIDSLSDALSQHVSNINSQPSGYSIATGMPAPAIGPGPDDWKSDETERFKQAIASLSEFRASWAGVAKTAFSGTDEQLEQQIKGTAGKQKELASVLDNAMKLAQNAAYSDRMFAIYRGFILGLGIAVVTFGVGEIVSGVAVGAGLAEGGAGVFLLSSGAEALTMTTLNAPASGKEGWENFGTDFLGLGYRRDDERRFAFV